MEVLGAEGLLEPEGDVLTSGGRGDGSSTSWVPWRSGLILGTDEEESPWNQMD